MVASGHQLSKMATIVRVKRRRDEDPLEILLLSQKKLKTEDEDHKKDVETLSENVLKFAGTVYTKVKWMSLVFGTKDYCCRFGACLNPTGWL